MMVCIKKQKMLWNFNEIFSFMLWVLRCTLYVCMRFLLCLKYSVNFENEAIGGVESEVRLKFQRTMEPGVICSMNKVLAA